MSYTNELRLALEAAAAAAQLCSAVRAAMVGAAGLEKDDKSPVTVADYGAQALICRRLAEAFPRDVIVAEEDSADLRRPEQAPFLEQAAGYVRRFYPSASAADVCDWIDLGGKTLAERYWTLDPIDGTKGFLRNDQYAVALALVEDGQVKLGVLACPALPARLDDPGAPGQIFSAVRGQGATVAALAGGPAAPIRVDRSPAGARLRMVASVEHGDQQWQERVAQRVGISHPAVRLDSQAKYGVVARGEAAIYLRLPSPKYPDYREKIWDHAAGALIVEEAGGAVSDIFGRPLDFAGGAQMAGNRGVVVSNGTLHPAIIEVLAQQAA